MDPIQGGLQFNRFSFLKDDDGGNTWNSARTDSGLFDRTNRCVAIKEGGGTIERFQVTS